LTALSFKTVEQNKTKSKLREPMVKLKLFIILLSILIASCGSIKDMKKMDKFEMATDGYERAIRWSDFDLASSFLKNQDDPDLAAQVENLKQFNVTSYKVKRFLPNADQTQILIIAEVQYFKKNGLIVKDISHRQLWEYDKDQKNWFLTSGLPALK
jgi:hypothetical protein